MPCTSEDVLRVLYELERSALQRNDWDNLRTPVAALVAECRAACPGVSDAVLLDVVRDLRRTGRLMFLPEWSLFEERGAEGELCDSATQHELANLENLKDAAPPNWKRRPVFLPRDPLTWSVRSRVAELARLLSFNRERFGLAPATGHVGFELQARYRPRREPNGLARAAQHLGDLVDQGHFANAGDPAQLKVALEIVARGVARANGADTLAAFQERAWLAILESLWTPGAPHRASMVTAGVSSGKTYAFILPILTLLVFRALRGEGGRNRALIVYPRTSLVEDQYHGLKRLLTAVNDELRALGLPTVTANPALDAGQFLGESIGADGSLADVLPEVASRRIEVVLTTPESLKNRMIDCRALATYLTAVEIVVFDEIHLMEGLSGCQGIYLVRRLRQLMRSLRGAARFEPGWVGASATVAEPVEHCARAFSLKRDEVAHIEPERSELDRFGTFHHVFVHTRVGKAAISAVTNGLSCVTHNRNDSTAHVHYEDPGATPVVPRSGADIPKTIAFVDSLSTIGRLRFTSADNERTYDAFSSTPPYYSWFYRPAARLRAPKQEVQEIERETIAGAMAEVRAWCACCFAGEPATLPRDRLGASAFRYVRTHAQMDDKAKKRATPPGLPERLAQLPDRVRNLDGCPYHAEGLCWWFSQDPGARMTVGTGQVFADQNRVLPYTSKSQDPEGGELHGDVNDYFIVDARQLWERAPVPSRPEATSTLLASPRIEVGVDFRNVRDGVTHKALRSASSFQQKAGRVGREDGSDSVVVTFLAHRTSDAHFAHHPARLINAEHLDPIPLKAENPDVIKSALFTAILDFIASRPPGTMANGAERLNIIGTGGTSEGSWEAKLLSCAGYLTQHRAQVRTYLVDAVQASAMQDADAAIDVLLSMIRALTTNLGGALMAQGSTAQWIRQNAIPSVNPAFQTVVRTIKEFADDRSRVEALPDPLRTPIEALLKEFGQSSPSMAVLTRHITALQPTLLQAMPALQAMQNGAELVNFTMATWGKISTLVNLFGQLRLSGAFGDVRLGYEILESFEKAGNSNQRRMSLHYFHSLLTTLLPFRQFYPFGSPRTQFQHVNQKQVAVVLPDGRRDSEPVDTALYELLPGTWNYRWLQPRKSPSGPIEQLGGAPVWFANLSNVEAKGAAFEPTGTSIGTADIPAEMPQLAAGQTVPILRPRELKMEVSFFRPTVDRARELIADDDESPRLQDPDAPQCPTLPRAFPASWYRVQFGPPMDAVRGHAELVGRSGDHEYPAFGRAVFESITFTPQMKVDSFVYAVDRTYGVGDVESPRIYYRRGSPSQPVVIGDELLKTDGLVFRLGPLVGRVAGEAAAAPGPVRGEILIRALRRFLVRETGCDPFQADLLRKVLLSAVLDAGKTLASVETSDIRNVLQNLEPDRYASHAQLLVRGMCAGVTGLNRTVLETRYDQWFEAAGEYVAAARAAAPRFDAVVLAQTARDLLVHSVAVVLMDAAGRLLGASDGDLGYFYNADRSEIYVFDTVEGGNGYAETLRRYFHVPPLERIVHSRGHQRTTLPDVDGFQLLDESLGDCPAQEATRVTFDSTQAGVTDPSRLTFPPTVAADLEARVRHEYSPITGSAGLLSYMAKAQPTLFATWSDLLWVQVVPERFAEDLAAAGTVSGIEDLRSRMQLCVTGCLECVDNADQSVHGSLASREHVSRTLLDALRAAALRAEPASYLEIPAGTSVPASLQAHAGEPVLDASRQPVTVEIDDNGTTRQILISKVLATVSPALGVQPGMVTVRSTGPGSGEVLLPFLVMYRDERPLT